MSKKKKVVFVGPIADGSCPKCKVGAAIEDHTCPFAQEFSNGEEIGSCNCCDECTINCANDI